ncbi:MAG: tRNA (cytidine(34)-2'-O)-methyltransferase [Alphaproteobacteria bacterium]|nr:tRNA (cytidine(34)-2'-O)-methyltransferase [Alphaproteobacteria bacterium]
MRVALFQPDIAQNTGTLLRLGACLGVGVDIIEPAGFDLSRRALKRSGLDYLEKAELQRHESFAAFEQMRRDKGGRLILLTTRASLPYMDFRFRQDDYLLLGRESAGVPDDVHDCADEAVSIPMRKGMRSLNVAIAGAMVLGEALRQTGGFRAD